MLWYSTPWTAPPFSNDPLWLTLFVGGVNDRLLDRCQVSSVPHYCAFKEQEIPTIYTVWMVIYWNSNVNILIFWDTDFWLKLAESSNHQNKNKIKLLKCFTLHVMNLKYMKASLLKKKIVFHHIQFFLGTCINSIKPFKVFILVVDLKDRSGFIIWQSIKSWTSQSTLHFRAAIFITMQLMFFIMCSNASLAEGQWREILYRSHMGTIRILRRHTHTHTHTHLRWKIKFLLF